MKHIEITNINNTYKEKIEYYESGENNVIALKTKVTDQEWQIRELNNFKMENSMREKKYNHEIQE